MAYLVDALYTIGNLGVMDVLVPFVLIFTIVFAVLQKTKILGVDKDKAPKKNFNVIIALIMGLAVVVPHVMGYYAPEQDVVNIINQALPNISIVVVAIVMLLLVIGVFGGEIKFAGTGLAGWAVLFAIITVLVTFGGAAGWFGRMPDWLYFLEDPDTQALVVVILVFAIVIWFVTKEPKKETDKKKTFLDTFGEVMGKKND
ncbi:MAG: hypothetical protein V1725_02975 [archaeon]